MMLMQRFWASHETLQATALERKKQTASFENQIEPWVYKGFLQR
jgi:hypothetical protein